METKFDFIKNSKIFYTISILILAVIILFCFRGINLDIQFKGGSIVTYSYHGDIDPADFESNVQKLVGSNVNIQESSDLATGEKTIVLTLAGGIESEKINSLNTMLSETYPENNVEVLSFSNVDAVMGREFLAKCLTAVGIASLLMMFYVAWRFKKIGGLSAGAMALLALAHDVVVVFGVFVIFKLPINDNFIAVVLTILGYSLNDTIVIYDRIRENRAIMKSNMPIAELVNRSINQSFTRTLFTSITTILAMLVVTAVAYFNNVSSIITFSFPMLIGLISGSYSSICIAGPLWVKWMEFRQKTA